MILSRLLQMAAEKPLQLVAEDGGARRADPVRLAGILVTSVNACAAGG